LDAVHRGHLGHEASEMRRPHRHDGKIVPIAGVAPRPARDLRRSPRCRSC
jgi:hypothetical protein